MADETLGGTGGLIDAVGNLFGTSSGTKGKSSGVADSITNASQSTGVRGDVTRQLILDPAAIDQIIRDVLGGTEGLAAIFGGEKASGLFNSSVANQAAGDLAAKLVGEIAKITGKDVTKDRTTTRTTSQQRAHQSRSQTSNTESDDNGGVLGGIGDALGF